MRATDSRVRNSRVRIRRVRKGILGTAERPRLAVHRSLSHISCQVIDDVAGETLVATSSAPLVRKGELKSGGNKAAAVRVGQEIAALAMAKGIKKVVFDRRSYQFHGRVRALAEGARKAGMEL